MAKKVSYNVRCPECGQFYSYDDGAVVFNVDFPLGFTPCPMCRKPVQHTSAQKVETEEE